MFPNPANYYLPMPEQLELEVCKLDHQGLARLNWRLSALLDDVIYEEMEIDEDTEFLTYQEMSSDFEQWVLTLTPDQIINLTRWVTERLAYLYQKEVSAKA